MTGPAGWLDELRRRSVFRVAAWYGALAWLVIQFAISVFPTLGVPAVATRGVVIAALLGFPVAVALAWAFEVSRDRSAAAPVTRTAVFRSPSLWVGCGAAALLGVGGYHALRSLAEPAVDRPVLLVLMPTDLRAEGDRDELPTQLLEALLDVAANEPSIVALARHSLDGRGPDEPTLAFAQRLGASHFLESSIQSARDAHAVEFTLQLIDARDGRHVLSLTDRHARHVKAPFQRDVATTAIGAIRLMLGPPTWADDDTIATDSAEAEFLFRQAELNRRYALGPPALESLDRALTIDPDFHQAFGRKQAIVAFDTWRPNELRRLDQVLTEPHPPEVERALDQARAIRTGHDAGAAAAAAYEALAARFRGDPLHHVAFAYQLRNIGRYDESLTEFERSVAADPYYWFPYSNYGYDALAQGDPGRAVHALSEALQRRPALLSFAHWRLLAELRRTGDVRAARGALHGIIADFHEGDTTAIEGLPHWRELALALAYLEGDLEGSLRIARASGTECPDGGGYGFVYTGVLGESAGRCAPTLVAELLRHLGRPAEARAAARAPASRWRQHHAASTLDPVLKASLDASEIYWAALEGVPPGPAAFAAAHAAARGLQAEARPDALLKLALAAVWSEQHDAAVEVLTSGMTGYFAFHPAIVARDPAWAPLHDHPGFRALLERHGQTPVKPGVEP